MFIRNLSIDSRFFKCGKMVANYLIKNGVPEIARDGHLYVFRKTKMLERVLASMPWHLKAISKVEVQHGE